MYFSKFLILCFFLVINLVFGNWFTDKNKIFYNNEEFNLKGINHFGFETADRTPHGYNIHDIDFYLDFLKDNKFNALRIPFSYETVQHFHDQFPRQEMVSKISDEQCKKSPFDLMNCLFKKAQDRGIFIMLDFHTIDYKISEHPYGRLNKQEFYDTWSTVIDLAIKYPNFMAIDIQNEPHGSTTWNEYSTFVNDFVLFINNKYTNYNGLIFFEGLQDVNDAVWGGSFALMDHLITMNNKLIFSPHTYGPSVIGVGANVHDAKNFDRWYGFLKTIFSNAIVIGEFGGLYNLDTSNQDYWWHERLVDYLISIDQRNSFYWCLNPDSYDTKGVLYDDWTYKNYQKLNLLNRLQPNPTIVKFNSTNNSRNLRSN